MSEMILDFQVELAGSSNNSDNNNRGYSHHAQAEPGALPTGHEAELIYSA